MRSHLTPSRCLAALAVISLYYFPFTSASPGRSLLSFKETKGNVSYRCSPSGLCLPCQYSEKNNDIYRCSETGYRFAIKCVEKKKSVKNQTNSKHHRRLSSIKQYKSGTQKPLFSTITNDERRKLLDDSSKPESLDHSYTAYRSCIPIDREERLSVIGFEIIMVGLLLVSGPVVYMRQRRRVPASALRF